MFLILLLLLLSFALLSLSNFDNSVDDFDKEILDVYDGIYVRDETIDEEGFDSDLLKLAVEPSLVDQSVDGLYAKASFDTVQIVCELKGDLIPLHNIYYGSSLPVVLNNITLQKYGLEGNSVCHHTQDCIDTSSTNLNQLGNCTYNAFFHVTELGKIFLYNKGPVAAGEEFYVSYGR